MATRSRALSTESASAAGARIPVRKTYKLYVGGQFPRSESGRSYVVRSPDGTPLANAVRSSRKDVRDAVRTARNAAGGWAGKTAYDLVGEGKADKVLAYLEAVRSGVYA